MTKDKYDQLWKDLISKSINDYLIEHRMFEFAVNEDKLKEAIYHAYENEYKPQFKGEFMIDDSEGVDEVRTDGEKRVKIDRHKVAALLYLAIVKNDKCPFIKLKERNINGVIEILACHQIAYSISLNCINSFIEEAYRQSSSCPHKAKFLNNNGFDKLPNLICERYASYKESIIPRMVWATDDVRYNNPSKLVSVNANMLANVFYFLELHSAS